MLELFKGNRKYGKNDWNYVNNLCLTSRMNLGAATRRSVQCAGSAPIPKALMILGVMTALQPSAFG